MFVYFHQQCGVVFNLSMCEICVCVNCAQTARFCRNVTDVTACTSHVVMTGVDVLTDVDAVMGANAYMNQSSISPTETGSNIFNTAA